MMRGCVGGLLRSLGHGSGAGDFPDPSNVLNDDTTNGVAGTYVAANPAYYKSGEQFGADGIEFLGTYTAYAGSATGIGDPVNPDKLIKAIIDNNSTITDLVGSRYAPHGKQDSWSTSQACILWTNVTGDVDPQTPIKRGSWRFLCFGGSQSVQDAMDVALALEAVFNGAQMIAASEGILLSGIQDGLPQPLTDPDTREVYVSCTFELEMRGPNS